MLSHTKIKCKNRAAAAIFHGPGPPHPSRARRFCQNSHKPLANRAVSAYNASRINFFPRRIFHGCESKKQLHRLHRLCPGRRRKRCGRRQYLAVSLPCRQGRGRRRGGRVFHRLHHLQSRPCVLYAHFPGGHRLHRLSGGWRRASKSFPGSSCRGCCFWSSASRSTP